MVAFTNGGAQASACVPEKLSSHSCLLLFELGSRIGVSVARGVMAKTSQPIDFDRRAREPSPVVQLGSLALATSYSVAKTTGRKSGTWELTVVSTSNACHCPTSRLRSGSGR